MLLKKGDEYMREIVKNWVSKNEITTPLQGTPAHRSSGIIKAIMKDGKKVAVGRIDYEEMDEENYQYIIYPYWDMIDGLTYDIFQGIPGIDMDLRLEKYYRVNYTPVFITERSPAKNREDLWELLESVGLDYYDRFEWLLRTNLRCGNDNLVVDRRRYDSRQVNYSKELDIGTLQYGDSIVVNNLSDVANNVSTFSEKMYDVLINGIDVVDVDGQNIIGFTQRSAMLAMILTQYKLYYQSRKEKQREGIEEAKSKGKYQGRKPIEVDYHLLEQVSGELDSHLITVEQAMKRVGITSRSTFYRKLKTMKTKM